MEGTKKRSDSQESMRSVSTVHSQNVKYIMKYLI